MAKYHATINGKEVMAVTYGYYGGKGYIPAVQIGNDSMRLPSLHVDMTLKEAEVFAGGVLEHIGFTRVEESSADNHPPRLVVTQRYCPYCGFQIHPGEKICGECACEEDGV